MEPGDKNATAVFEPERTYTIGEAADLLEISVPTMRYYESEGLIIPIRRKSRHRRYSETDLNRIRCLRRTINEDKISIAGIKHLLAMIPCWTIRQCSEEARSACGAYVEHSVPCWKVPEESRRCGETECRTCSVYTMTADCSNLKQTITRYPGIGTPPTDSTAGER